VRCESGNRIGVETTPVITINCTAEGVWSNKHDSKPDLNANANRSKERQIVSNQSRLVKMHFGAVQTLFVRRFSVPFKMTAFVYHCRLTLNPPLAGSRQSATGAKLPNNARTVHRK
jgi:hypothetical protein